MANPAPGPRPGHDEIVITAPPARCLCHSRQHTRLGLLADVLVTFGDLGTRWHPDALWQESWGRTYAMCAECWDTTHQIAHNARPGLTVTDTRPPRQ